MLMFVQGLITIGEMIGSEEIICLGISVSRSQAGYMGEDLAAKKSRNKVVTDLSLVRLLRKGRNK